MAGRRSDALPPIQDLVYRTFIKKSVPKGDMGSVCLRHGIDLAKESFEVDLPNLLLFAPSRLLNYLRDTCLSACRAQGSGRDGGVWRSKKAKKTARLARWSNSFSTTGTFSLGPPNIMCHHPCPDAA